MHEEDPFFPDIEHPSSREINQVDDTAALQLTYARMREKMHRMENPTN